MARGLRTVVLGSLLLFGTAASAQVVIKGNVYGGCNVGEVVTGTVDGMGNTTVIVNSGTIGEKLSLEERKTDDNAQIPRVHHGNVYGGGNGFVDYTPNIGVAPSFNIDAGRVQGNTNVTVQGDAVVRHAVYGGGNIATVGTCTFDDDDDAVPDYTAGTGRTTVTIQGNALIGPTKTDLTTATTDELTAAGGITEDQYTDSCFKYLGGNEGWVFGGSRGYAGSELNQYSFVDSTIVLVTGNAQVMSVFGGGENGHVKKGTNVTINDHAVIGGVPLHGAETTATSTSYEITSGPYRGVTVNLKKADGELLEDEFGVGRTIFRGNVFGGGKGTDFVLWATTPQYSYSAGRVYGNATLAIGGNAQIYNRVYGGGPVASVGTFTYASATSHTITGIEGKTGHTFVTVNGGTIGTDGLNNGDVYGGGRGIPGRPKKNSSEALGPLNQVLDLAYVGHTHVTVDGGTIKNSVYGGAANGHVQGHTNVLIKETTPNTTFIGVSGQGGWHSNVYAGGGGTMRYKENNKKKFSITAGRVFGNTYLTIEGGTIYHNVYGGGSLASVGTYLKNNAQGQFQSYLGGGKATLNILGGTIGTDGDENGMVYGSGRGEIAAPGHIFDTLTYIAYTFVNIGKTGETGPTVKGSVYGSGENGHVYLESKVNVYSGTIGCTADDYAHYTNSSDPLYDVDFLTDKFPYRGNVYGAGCGTDKYDSDDDGVRDTYNPNSGYVWGETEVNIHGGYISRNVYGGGAMGSVGYIYHPATVKHKYIDYTTQPSLSWPYALTYIQIPDSTSVTPNYPTTGNTGKATVNIYGGHIGTLAAPVAESGNVFGSARGDVGPLGVMDSLAIVRETEVNIDFTPWGTSYASVADTTKNVIIGSVFGSGEDGSVYEDAKVTVTNGLIGGSVFGGGSGTSTYKGSLWNDNNTQTPEDDYLEVNVDLRSITAGKVYGNTEVEITGGIITHNVYGGGNLASVGKGNYMGYGEMSNVSVVPPSSTPYESSGKCVVKINGGTIGTDGLPDSNGNINALQRASRSPRSAILRTHRAMTTAATSSSAIPTRLRSPSARLLAREHPAFGALCSAAARTAMCAGTPKSPSTRAKSVWHILATVVQHLLPPMTGSIAATSTAQAVASTRLSALPPTTALRPVPSP